ncbi:UNVERIFIED_CONTAM: hypothetical protein FKN15_048626 [Acipenser sinensis]
MDRNALAELLQALESRRDAEERRREERYTALIERPTAFFHTADSPCNNPRATALEDNAALGQLTGKPAGARPDYRGCWCAVSRANPPSPRAALGQLSAAPWKLPSSVGKGIAWTQTCDVQTIERIALHVERLYWMCHSGAPGTMDFDVSFMNVIYLEKFWNTYQEIKDSQAWIHFKAVPVSEPDIRQVSSLETSQRT